ncbi:hypothetical protein [Microvirga sp. VF16]|uniref:hypothetical protein n=1 Tax=Microvirga sp. VF16 TaxID=2807101 RepID=UPI00193C8987|nr:hypothetical protein [Microvirga sp. VF16]
MRNSLVGDILLTLPWWVRGALFGALSIVVALSSSCLLFHAFDRRPDFIVGPEGIRRNFIFRVGTLSWAEIQSVNVQENTIKVIGPPNLKMYGQNAVIEFDRGLFAAAARVEVLNLIRHYRPDLPINERTSQL